MLRKVPFIKPMAPTLAKTPPAGSEWLHEVKFDGWRTQVHIDAGAATLYSKNGADYYEAVQVVAAGAGTSSPPEVPSSTAS